MSGLSRALIGVTFVLAVGVAAWMRFSAIGPTPTVLGVRSAGDPVEQPSQPVEPEALVAERPVDPPVNGGKPDTAKDEPANVAPSSAAPLNDEHTGAASAVAAKDPSALPVDLTDHYRFKAADFDRVTQYPWPAAPRGSQTFANVPLEIGGAIMLWGGRNAERGMVYPEQLAGVSLHRKFETLYVCHGYFFEGPSGTPVCEAVFHYDDGTSAADTIRCGVDGRDWFADRAQLPLGPSEPRSTLAWIGDGKQGERTQAIRFCLTAIANPHADKEVTAIDFVSSKSQTAACILAITTGKSGLMKRTEETPPAAATDK